MAIDHWKSVRQRPIEQPTKEQVSTAADASRAREKCMKHFCGASRQELGVTHFTSLSPPQAWGEATRFGAQHPSFVECECGNVLLLENVILACMWSWRRAGALLLNVIEQRPGVPASGQSPIVTKATILDRIYKIRGQG